MNPHHFPDHLIYKILSWLPTKSMIRFRCVSKTWNSLIHDPYFLQLRRSINRTNNLFLFVCPNPCDWETESSYPNVFLGHVPIDEDQGHLELNSSTRILSMPDLLCDDLDVQSVNGLLCFHPKRNWLWKWFSSQHASVTTHIFNPTTRQVVTLPHDNNIDFYPEYRLLTHFGYDPLGDKFKVLRVILNDKDFQELRILTVGDYVWRNIVTPPCDHHLMSNLTDIGTCVNGAIHWLDETHKVITVFDVGTEQFRQIPIFDDRLLLQPIGILIEFGGYLSLVNYVHRKMELLDLSILKDYENNVWIHERIILPDGLIPMNMTRQGYYELVCRVYTQEIMFLRYCAYNNPFKVYYYDTKTRSCRSILLMEVPMPLSRDLDFGGVQLLAYQENFKRL